MSAVSPTAPALARLRALLAQCKPEEVFTLDQIAEVLGVSSRYAGKLLQVLQHAGEVECARVYRRFAG